VAFSQLQPKQVLDNCLRCHSQTLSRANIRRSLHTQNDVVCTNCHSIHKSPTPKFLLASVQAELCYGCHADVRSQFSMPFKHRVNEGVMTCTDCHNPHGAFPPTWRMADRPHMMDQVLANEEPCLKCHEEKRGPFVYEHPPVRIEGCEACHFPHGSPNSRLLRRPVVFTMCLECHNGAPGFSRTGSGDPVPVSFHDLRSPRFQNCTNCHGHIHGSNVDAFFLK
jgi:DmsE family decaheme c-type cytochrome